jgi:hypothetical protein
MPSFQNNRKKNRIKIKFKAGQFFCTAKYYIKHKFRDRPKSELILKFEDVQLSRPIYGPRWPPNFFN